MADGRLVDTGRMRRKIKRERKRKTRAAYTLTLFIASHPAHDSVRIGGPVGGADLTDTPLRICSAANPA